MGLKFFGGPSREYPALLPSYATFVASGPSGNLRPRRVHITLRNRFGTALGIAATVPFFISGSSLGTSATPTSALSSGTIAATLPIAITSNGGLLRTEPGRAGYITCETNGRIRLSLSQSSLADRNVYLVLMMPQGNRSISSQIRISS